ncbi:MAG: hypothetical protein QXO86_07110 [Nitrososphaerota archaeon]
MSKTAKLLRRSLLGVVVSIGITLLIVALFNVSIHRLLSIPMPILLSSIAICISRLVAQGLRFHILVRYCSSINMRFRDSFIARGASEFFALTTIPFVADEAVRTWILTERGEKALTALWIAFSELFFDVLIAAPISIMAGGAALMHREVGISSVILAISVSQILMVLSILLLARRVAWSLLKLVEPLSRLSPFIKRVFDRTREELPMIADASQLFTGRPIRAVIPTTFALTIVIMTTPALILYMVHLNYSELNLLDSLYAFHAGNTLGVLPLTVGGSGLTETGIYLFSDRVYARGNWEAVVIWRVLTYYLTLLMTGAIFVNYVLWRSRRS